MLRTTRRIPPAAPLPSSRRLQRRSYRCLRCRWCCRRRRFRKVAKYPRNIPPIFDTRPSSAVADYGLSYERFSCELSGGRRGLEKRTAVARHPVGRRRDLVGGELAAGAGENRRRNTATFVEHRKRLRFDRDTAQCQRDGPTWWAGARAARPEAAPRTIAPREADADSRARYTDADSGAHPCANGHPDATADADGDTAPYSHSNGNTCADANANRHTAADRNAHGLADAGP